MFCAASAPGLPTPAAKRHVHTSMQQVRITREQQAKSDASTIEPTEESDGVYEDVRTQARIIAVLFGVAKCMKLSIHVPQKVAKEQLKRAASARATEKHVASKKAKLADRRLDELLLVFDSLVRRGSCVSCIRTCAHGL